MTKHYAPMLPATSERGASNDDNNRECWRWHFAGQLLCAYLTDPRVKSGSNPCQVAVTAADSLIEELLKDTK